MLTLNLTHVVAALEAEIRSGHIAPGDRLPSERLLARRFEISRGLVREAISELKHMGLVVCEPNKCPRVAALSLRSIGSKSAQKNHLYAVIQATKYSFSTLDILRGIQESLDNSDYKLIVSTPKTVLWGDAIQNERDMLHRMTEDPQAAGAVVWYLGERYNIDVLQHVERSGIPMVFVDRRPPAGFSADYVGTDNVHVAFSCVKFLLRLGHKRIAFFTNTEKVSSVQEREEGFRRAMRRNGIKPPEHWIRSVSSDQKLSFEDNVRTSIETLMSEAIPPTAILAINDQVAIQTQLCLKELGINISVMGVDGWLRAVPGHGGLSTAVQQFDRMGEIAMELLCQRIQGVTTNTYREILLDAPLMIEASTQPLLPYQSINSMELP